MFVLYLQQGLWSSLQSGGGGGGGGRLKGTRKREALRGDSGGMPPRKKF